MLARMQTSRTSGSAAIRSASPIQGVRSARKGPGIGESGIARMLSSHHCTTSPESDNFNSERPREIKAGSVIAALFAEFEVQVIGKGRPVFESLGIKSHVLMPSARWGHRLTLRLSLASHEKKGLCGLASPTRLKLWQPRRGYRGWLSRQSQVRPYPVELAPRRQTLGRKPRPPLA